jgi:L-lactate dehydrogenase
MTMVAQAVASPLGFAPGRLLTTGTLLDSSRFRSLLAQRLDVAVSSVHASIVGEHGDSCLPLWSSATVGHTPLHVYEPRGKRAINVRDRVAIFESVRGAAQEIIAGKGATDSAIGLTVARLCRAILRDEKAVLTVGSVHEQAPPGVTMDGPTCFSLPTVVGRAGVDRVVLEVPMNDAEKAGLSESVRVIRAAYGRVKS